MSNFDKYKNKGASQLKGELTQEADSDDVLIDGQSGDVVGGSMKNRLPFGLCKKYGIEIGDNWTPRDAWNALKGIGVDPKEEYEKLEANDANISDVRVSEDNAEHAIDRMVSDERVIYSKRLTEKDMRDNLNAGEREIRDVTVRLFNDDSFGYNSNERSTAYYPGFNKVCLREPNIGGEEFNSAYAKGGVFYHETWHAIDNNYSADGSVYGGLSFSYKLKSGLTIQDTVTAEARSADWNAVKNEIEKEIDAHYLTKGKNRQEIISKYKSVSARAQQIWDEEYQRTNSWFDANIAKIKYVESEEYVFARNEFLTVKDTPEAIKRKWGDVSDIYSGAKMISSGLVGMGHEKSYWRKDKSNKGSEFFAECASAKATNPESYALLKRLFPRSVQGFEEIYTKLQKGELKSNGRPKYQR